MAATLRLKQLLFIAAALALTALGLVAALSPASPARADDTTCVDQVVTQWFETDPGAPWVATGASRVKTEGTDPTYTDWVNEGEPVRTETNVAPSADGDLEQYVSAGTVDDSTEGHWDNTEVTFYTWTGGNSADAPPVYADETQTSLHDGWNPTNGNPQGGPHAAAPPLSPYEAGSGPNTASWFLKAGSFVPGVEDTDYLWQKQVRTPVPGTDDVIEYEYTKTIECPPPGPDCEANPQAEGCPAPPCEETDTCPPVEKPWICHPVNGKGELGNGWNLINPNDPSSHIIESEYPDGVYWEHMSNDGLRHDVYADLKEGEDGKDQADYTCPGDQLTEVTPHGRGPHGRLRPRPVRHHHRDRDGGRDLHPAGRIVGRGHHRRQRSQHGDRSSRGGLRARRGCGVAVGVRVHPGSRLPGTAVRGAADAGGRGCPEPPCEETEEGCPEPPCEETEEGCPEPPCEETEEGCPEPPCEETEEGCPDPGPTCEEDPTQPGCDENKPPVVVPDDGSTPSNGPTVKGAQATAPTNSAGVVAGTPAARVPTAIDAGLAPQQRELAGTGGGLGLLGIAAAFLGAALVGLTFRPRRIGAASRART